LPPINVQLAVAEKHDALQILIEKQKHLVATMQVDVGRMVDEIFGE
jgi:hypothetical protein